MDNPQELAVRINRAALEAAKAALGDDYHEETSWAVYVIAIVVAVVVYLMLQKMQPAFVMVDKGNGFKEFDKTRGLIVSAIAGLIVILVKHFMACN